ncbi:hypothetical protein LIER_31057 [Lithospermum erythrorhizon]|uniref:ZF-HD dimerization-type domain-containing protein n=1 Tax=Lithospermum erythrorhizon TaxID=34254 RepID=A0AAV3RVM5_LITER
MDFDEHEEQQREHDESGNYQPPTGNEGAPGAIGGNNNSSGISRMTYRYKHCMKNHAAGIGGQAMDGCGEFIAAGEDGTLEALRCAACNCHRNFHRKVLIPQGFINQYPPQPTHFPPYFRAPHPSGYLHFTPPPPPREDENMSNPSSRGGGGGSKKRHRTKFTQEQKDKMLAFAEKLGWRFQKQDEDPIMQFCNEINVNRQVFKVWMHNNKQSLGNKKL